MQNRESMYDTLLEFPLFKGVSHKQISALIGKTKFHFLKYLPETQIIRMGDECENLKFIVSGDVRITIANHNSRFSVSQTLTGPDIILPDFLFGRATHYPCTAVTLNTVSLFEIEKADYLKIIAGNNIFLINYLNYLSMNAQKAVDGVLALSVGDIESRIAYWIIALTQPTGHDITLACRTRDLSSVFGVQRSSLMAALDNMEKSGLITYGNNLINITDRRGLLQLLEHNREIVV